MRNEYPRPELVRDKWLSLNGKWEFAFDFGASGTERYFYDGVRFRFDELAARKFDREINVPFCPESKLSGIEYTDFIGACMYKKTVKIPSDWNGKIILRFEAAFYETHVVVNGKYLGSHSGGYTPFAFDVTDCIADGEANIFVYCSGDSRNPRQPSGKQSMTYNSMICTYTRSTGIWQSVWLECVPDVYVTKMKFDPDVDNSRLNAKLTFSARGKKKVTLTASYDGKEVGKATATTTTNEVIMQLPLDELRLWSIDEPNLYDLRVEVKSDRGCDEFSSYFGMRKIEWDNVGLILNGERVCMRTVLDQGYYPDGIYTAPTAEDLAKDIVLSQAVGFNGARLHERVFERRFLYECDKRGYIVWGEYPSWGFDWTVDGALEYYLGEWMESMERDYNHPALIGWAPLNETYWELFGRKPNLEFTKQLYIETKRFDSVRPCVDSSGGVHTLTDFYDTHEYFQDTAEFDGYYRSFKDGEIFETGESRYAGQPYWLSEFGGIRLIDGTGDTVCKTEAEFRERVLSFLRTLMANPRMCGFCYTQLYDIEQENTGLYNYDRSPKLSEETIRAFREQMTKIAEVEKQPIKN